MNLSTVRRPAAPCMLLLVAALAALVVPASAGAAENNGLHDSPGAIDVGSCKATPGAPLYREQLEPPDKPTKKLVTTPAIIEIDRINSTQRCRIELYNDSKKTSDITLSATDLGPASDPKSIAAKVEESEFGAGEWISFDRTHLRLKPFERVRLDVTIQPPSEAPIGTNLAGISVDAAPAEGPIGSADYTGSIRVEALIQAYFTVPGPVDHGLAVKRIDLRDRFAFKGSRFAVWEITFDNDGTVNEHVTGSISIRSLFGTSAERFELKDLIVLRGSTRAHRVVWANVPWVGAFHPELRVRGDDAKVIKATGPRIIVFPWWLIVLIVVSILVPFVVSWRRRRLAWDDYHDDLELAAAQPGDWDGADAEWDDDREPDQA